MAPHSRRVKRPKFEPEIVQKALVNMLITHELPFAVVQRDEVKNTIETAFPGLRIPSSETMTWDCFQLFMDEKLKLKSFIKMMKQRVCLSLDTWKTNQSVTYLCITAHFIDGNWNLHKKVIGFSPICSDNGEEIGQVTEECLHDWEINHVLAVSAGKASSYDAAVTYLGTRFANPVMGDNVDFHLNSWGRSCTRNWEPEDVSRAFGLMWISDEYFGDVENSNMLIYVASILDPRSKTNIMEFYFANTKYRYNSPHEGNPFWKKKAEWVVACIYDLFNEYAAKIGGQQQTAKFQTSGYMSYLYHDTGPRGLFQKRVLGFGGNARCKSEIDIYLNEDEEFEDGDGFDILLWWKVNSERFPVLSRMAKDVLAIPIAAVALESDINIDGNLLDDFRGSLSPPMVEALVCTQDWIKSSKLQYRVEDGSTKVVDKILEGIYEQLEGATG